MNPVRKKIPTQIVPFVTVSRKACASPGAVSWTAPICDMPRFSIRSPALAHNTIAKTMTSVLIRSLLSLAIWRGLIVAGSGRRSGYGDNRLLEIAAFAHPLQAFGAQRQEFDCLVIQAFPLLSVPQRLFHDAPHNLRPKIILIIEAVHARHHLRLREMWVLDVRELVAAGIRQRLHFQETLLCHGVVQFRSRHGMRQRNLDRLAIEFLCEINGLLNRLLGLARQSDDEVAVNLDPHLAAVLHERAAHFNRCALLDVLEDLWFARFEAYDKEPRSAIRHRFYRFVVAVHPCRRRPLELQRLELRAKIQNAVLADVESVVVEEDFLHLRKISERLLP